MPIEIRTFQNFVDSDPQADRLAIRGTAPQQNLENARSGNLLTWAVKLLGEYMPWQSNAVTAQNNDAISAFRDALTDAFGTASNAHAPAGGTGQPLTAHAVKIAIQDSKSALYTAATRPDASDAERRLASEAIIRDVKLTPGPLGPLMQQAISNVLLGLLPHVLPLDGTPRLDLIGKLGSQLVTRLEDPLSRALEAYSLQADAKEHENKKAQADATRPNDAPSRAHDRGVVPSHPAVATLMARLAAEGDPIQALKAAVPKLDGHLKAEIKGFETSVKTLMARVAADDAQIGARFHGASSGGALTDVHLTNSDPHKGGNRVAILTFGADSKVVYKPRDVRIDDAISGSERGALGSSLMQQAGAANSVYKFMPKADADGEYGYVQYLPNREGRNHLVDASHAPAMFHELGRACAALMLAGATDIHHENLMVSDGGMYFTDLEFALNKGVMNELLFLLGGTPAAQAGQPGSSNPQAGLANAANPQAAAPPLSMARLMESIMLDQALTWATDSNPLHAQRPLVNGEFTPAAMYEDVPESLLIIKTPTGYVNNRYAAPGPDSASIYKPYGADFGEGLASGLAALKQQGGLTNFLRDIQGMHLRYHPVGTLAQREILQQVFHEDYNGKLAGHGPTSKEMLQGRLQAIPSLAQDAGKRDVLASTMHAAYALHDIPYYSRVIGDPNLYPDGRPGKDAGCGNFFAADIDAHANALNTHFLGTPDDKLTELGSAAGKWLGSRAPTQEPIMSTLESPETDDMIAAVTQVRPR